MEGSGAGLAAPAVWGAASGGVASSESVDGGVAGRIDELELLAIASPSPPKIDIGNENSASQCSPVTQLNRPIPTYRQTTLIAQNCIALLPLPLTTFYHS